MTRKAQITLFIIIGIVLLLVLGLGIAAWKYFALERPPEDKILEETNLEVVPVSDYAKNCIQLASINVFKRMGEHGGYYAPENYFAAVPTRPTESRALEAFPGQLVPYWSYMSSRNDCTDCSLSSLQPPLEGTQFPAAQAQAEQAIADEFLACVNGFTDLQERFTITPNGVPVVHVSFGEHDTFVKVDYVVEVQTQAGTRATLREFSTRVDVPFKKAYDTASNIRQAADHEPAYFAGLTLDLVTLESSTDSTSIPPPFGPTQFTYAPGPYWSLPVVQQRVAAILENNINLVQLFGSRDMDYVSTGDPTTDNQYANFYFSIPDVPPDVKANFVYLSDWTPYVAVHPGGQLIQPQASSTGLPFLPPMKRMQFQYDVSYPVLVQLEIPTEKSSFFFQFPLEVNMRNNNPLSTDLLVAEEQSISFCDPAQAQGTTATITVTDAAGKPVDGAVRYSCVTDSCPLPATRAGVVRTQLPICINGEVTFEREGYVPVSAPLSSLEGSASVVLETQKLTTVTIEPQAYYLLHSEFKDGAWSWSASQSTHTISTPNKLILIFSPRDHPELTQVVQYPAGVATAQLYPGAYDVVGVITQELDSPKVLLGKQVCANGSCYDIPPIEFGAKKYVDDQGVEHDIGTQKGVLYLGGLQLDDSTKPLVLTQEMLDAKTLSIPVFEVYDGDLQSVDDLVVFDTIDDFSNKTSIS